MSALKNAYHDELEAKREIAEGHCAQCGEAVDLGSEAWQHGLCRGCFDEANGQFGVGA